MTHITAPIPAEYRTRGTRAIANVRSILAAHRPDDLDTMRRFDGARAAIGNAAHRAVK